MGFLFNSLLLEELHFLPLLLVVSDSFFNWCSLVSALCSKLFFWPEWFSVIILVLWRRRLIFCLSFISLFSFYTHSFSGYICSTLLKPNYLLCWFFVTLFYQSLPFFICLIWMCNYHCVCWCHKLQSNHILLPLSFTTYICIPSLFCSSHSYNL